MSSAISRIDHVGIYTGRPDQVFRFFTDDLCLPVAFPLTTYPSYTTGSIALGNCFLEITKLYLGDLLGTNLWQRLFLAATRRSTPRPSQARSPVVRHTGVALLLRSFPAGMPVVTAYYRNLEQHARAVSRSPLAECGGGALGIECVHRVTVGAADWQPWTRLTGEQADQHSLIVRYPEGPTLEVLASPRPGGRVTHGWSRIRDSRDRADRGTVVVTRVTCELRRAGMRQSRESFISQQGFAVPNANPHLYSALMFQPRVIGGVVVLGTMFQRPEPFLALAAVMAWAALVPTRNLFDAVYNYTVAYPRGFPPLRAAPAPRRFAQGGAATLALAIGLALLTGATSAAWVLEGAALVSVASVLVRRFCVPAYLYYVLRRMSSWMFGVPVGSASPRC